MKSMLLDAVRQTGEWVELRYHRRMRNVITAQGGRIETAVSTVRAGVGVRTLVNGAFGFSSTDDLTPQSINKAVNAAISQARALSRLKKEKVAPFPLIQLATTDFIAPGYDSLLNTKLQDKMDRVVQMEREGKNSSQYITRATASYSEFLEDKIVVTSDGASAHQLLAQPEIRFFIIAEKGGEHSTYYTGAGVSGDWVCLFNHPKTDRIVEKTSAMAVDLLSAGHAEGGAKTEILSPALVGLLSHEAIGHTVEADFVASGSVAKGKIGQRVGSDLVTLCDAGSSPFGVNPSGQMAFDDEGVPCKTVTIIDKGILNSYLHSRESAVLFGVEPTGNGRAWEYDSDPLIRMRNTYVEPGDQTLDEIIASTPDGLLLDGGGSGQADATGEFMFGVGHGLEIKDGKLTGKKFRELTISGVAFDVLKTVDAVSSDFRWELGTGLCGKGQPAKVDAGGPYLRCKINLGGRN